MRSVGLRAVLASVVLLLSAACGDEAAPPAPGPGPTPPRDGRPAPPTTPPAETPPASPKPPASGDPDDTTSYTGTVEPMGVSIHMQGTHKLTEGGATVVLLRSGSVALSTYEGKRVRVKGKASPTVEGAQTIVDVESIEEVR
jgi:hypothetical protein